jgi:pimeloyl-ACP methyl ester carboxylesterase
VTAPERVARLVLVAPAVTGAPDPEEAPPAIQRLTARIEEAEAAEDLERLNGLEAHAWLDGPLSEEGHVGGTVRCLFLEMNERALGSPPAGAETSATNAFVRLDEVRHETLLVSGALDFPHGSSRWRVSRTCPISSGRRSSTRCCARWSAEERRRYLIFRRSISKTRT